MLRERFDALFERFASLESRIAQLEEPLVVRSFTEEAEKVESQEEAEKEDEKQNSEETEDKDAGWYGLFVILCADVPLQIIVINALMVFLFYKQLYNEPKVILSMIASGDYIFASVILCAIVLSPIIDTMSRDWEELTWSAWLRKVFLIDAGFVWLSMVKKYMTKILHPDRQQVADTKYYQLCAQWVHEFRQHEKELSKSLASEQMASIVVVAVEVFALFARAKVYWPDSVEVTTRSRNDSIFAHWFTDTTVDEARQDLIFAISVSLFTIGVQRTRLDLAGSPFGSISFSEHVSAWAPKQLEGPCGPRSMLA